MSTQQAVITDTIINLKRALNHRERGNFSQFPDEPVIKPSNRGIKLAQGSEYIREGALGPLHGRQYFRKRVKHADYERDIQDFNTAVYDSEGDEIEDDGQRHMDNVLNEEVPFGDIRFEALLCPLRHPSELEHHPSMSEPYRSKVLKHMIRSINERLQRERNVLHKAKRLHREFVGDVPWMPCGFLETPQDRSMFIPEWTTKSKERQAASSMQQPQGTESSALQAVQMADLAEKDPIVSLQTGKGNNSNSKDEIESNSADKDNSRSTHNQHDESTVHTRRPPDSAGVLEQGTDSLLNVDESQPLPEVGTQSSSFPDLPSELQSSRRMTTRARAGTNAAHDYAGFEGADTDGDATESSFMIHPLYAAPRPPLDRACGLPQPEADEMRRALWSFIQKQEETVRGFEKMLTMLLKSNRMKDDVWEWCKAEAHLGELSDGEDWPEYERWGLQVGDLKKGADSDDEVPEEKSTKRGRGRRT